MAIPKDRPVIGRDLDEVRKSLDMRRIDMCFLLSMPVSRWLQITDEDANEPVKDLELVQLLQTLEEHPEVCEITKIVNDPPCDGGGLAARLATYMAARDAKLKTGLQAWQTAHSQAMQTAETLQRALERIMAGDAPNPAKAAEDALRDAGFLPENNQSDGDEAEPPASARPKMKS